MLLYAFFILTDIHPPGADQGKRYHLLFARVKLHNSSSALLKGESNLINEECTYCVTSDCSPAAREKDLLPPPSLEHQNPLRPRSKPPSGKTAPRKEPRSATSSTSSTAPPPAALQQTPAPAPAVAVNQVSLWRGGGCHVCLLVRRSH